MENQNYKFQYVLSIPFVLLFMISYSVTSLGQIGRYEKLSKEVVEIKKQYCKLESKSILSKLDLASMYYLHGELDDARALIRESTSLAKGAQCKKALSKTVSEKK